MINDIPEPDVAMLKIRLESQACRRCGTVDHVWRSRSFHGFAYHCLGCGTATPPRETPWEAMAVWDYLQGDHAEALIASRDALAAYRAEAGATAEPRPEPEPAPGRIRCVIVAGGWSTRTPSQAEVVAVVGVPVTTYYDMSRKKIAYACGVFEASLDRVRDAATARGWEFHAQEKRTPVPEKPEPPPEPAEKTYEVTASFAGPLTPSRRDKLVAAARYRIAEQRGGDLDCAPRDGCDCVFNVPAPDVVRAEVALREIPFVETVEVACGGEADAGEDADAPRGEPGDCSDPDCGVCYGAVDADSVPTTDRSEFPGGAVRSKDADGVRYDLISPIGSRRLAETYAEGAAKYGAGNWLKGFPASDLLNHLMKHVDQWRAGDRTEDHLAHAAWGLFTLMHFEEARPDLMDVSFATFSPVATRSVSPEPPTLP